MFINIFKQFFYKKKINIKINLKAMLFVNKNKSPALKKLK